jgi:hypothetical protein
MRLLVFLLTLSLFLLVTYPLVQAMTRVKGRAGMFIWRHQLADRRGPYWLK